MQYGSPVITDNTIIGNTAENSGGGGIYMYDSDPTITGNTITGNSAGVGGGIWLYAYSSPTITGNTITGNTANSSSSGGGGIFVTNSDPTITDNTITDNTANVSGGGIAVSTMSTLKPTDARPTGWGTGGENIPTGDPLVPVEGVKYTIAGNEFLGNEHGIPLDYTEGAHVDFPK